MLKRNTNETKGILENPSEASEHIKFLVVFCLTIGLFVIIYLLLRCCLLITECAMYNEIAFGITMILSSILVCPIFTILANKILDKSEKEIENCGEEEDWHEYYEELQRWLRWEKGDKR